MYVITGATGNIGRRIAESLLEKGKSVRVVGRSAEKLQGLVDKGALPFVGDMEDTAFLAGAFKGAKAAFCMIPPNKVSEDVRGFQNRIGQATYDALAGSGVAHVVNLSSQGAHLAEKTGPILGLHDQEERLNKLEGIHILHLRPTYFMENVLAGLDLIKHRGIYGSPLRADLSFPIIATQDIAAAAAQYLLALDFTGKSIQELLGAGDVTMKEITRALGTAIGKPDLPYVEFSYEDSKKAMMGMGLSENVADALVEMNRSINEGVGIFTTDRYRENTTETTIEEFAKSFASIYNM
ncbi:MAG: SDR family NAD(P)-dependent oxidoreductase [bacterium]|nr:SDR family NAD(P)-dependent oxidoreductase [bacterium]